MEFVQTIRPEAAAGTRKTNGVNSYEIYYSTLTNARTKIVFGGLNDEDVDLIAKEVFTGELNPDEVKNEIWHRGFAPVESSRTVRGFSTSESSGESHGDVSHASLVNSDVFIPGSDFWSMPTPSSYSRASGRSSGKSHAHQSSTSSGFSESAVPFYEFHEYQELTSRTFRSLEEQLYLKKAQLKRQPNQHAAVLVPGQNVQFIKVGTLRDLPVSHRQQEEFRQACIETAGCYKSPQQAETEIDALEHRLLQEASPNYAVKTDGEPKAGESEPVKESNVKILTPIWNRASNNTLGTQKRTRSPKTAG